MHVRKKSQAVEVGAAVSLGRPKNPASVLLSTPPLAKTNTTPSTRPQASFSPRAKDLAAGALFYARKLEGEAKIRAAIDHLLAAPEARGSKIAINVSGPGGQTIDARSAGRPQNPASNSKLASAAFALGVLGPDHRFETTLSKDSEMNLIIRGGFDPSLTSDDVVEIAKRLKAEGVDVVEGDVLLDNSALVGDRIPAGFSSYGDQDWAYLARPEALSVDKNLVELIVHPGKRSGSPARIELAQAEAFELAESVKTIAPKTEFRVGVDERDVGGELVLGAGGRPIIEVFGTIAQDYTKAKHLVMKTPDPVVSFADVLRRAISKAGIAIKGEIKAGSAKGETSVVHVHQSQPLHALLKTSLSTSNAFDHEMLTLGAAQHISPDGTTSVEGAAEAMTDYLRNTLGLEGASMENGSGIGNLNRLSPADISKILSLSLTEPRFAAIASGLARPGEEGTLKARMIDTPAEGRLRAKTGTGETAVALSGIVGTESSIVFSCLIDEHATRSGARAILDALGIVLSSI